MKLFISMAATLLASVALTTMASAAPPEPQAWRPIPQGKTYTQVAQECRSWASSERAYADCINVQWPLLHAPQVQREAAQDRLNEEHRRQPQIRQR